MPGTSRENTAWMEEVISRTPRSNFLNTAVRWMYSQTIFLSTFDRFALILQAEEIVDVINDLQQAIVSEQSRPLYPLYIIRIDIIIRSVYHDVPCYNALQYTAMFVKDPAEKEEKMGDVTSKTLPQGLLRWWRRWGREITWFLNDGILSLLFVINTIAMTIFPTRLEKVLVARGGQFFAGNAFTWYITCLTLTTWWEHNFLSCQKMKKIPNCR